MQADPEIENLGIAAGPESQESSLQLPKGIAAGEEREAAVKRQNEAIVYATIQKYKAGHALSENEKLVMAAVLKDVAAQEEAAAAAAAAATEHSPPISPPARSPQEERE